MNGVVCKEAARGLSRSKQRDRAKAKGVMWRGFENSGVPTTLFVYYILLYCTTTPSSSIQLDATSMPVEPSSISLERILMGA